jgi:hypothetical protein
MPGKGLGVGRPRLVDDVESSRERSVVARGGVAARGSRDGGRPCGREDRGGARPRSGSGSSSSGSIVMGIGSASRSGAVREFGCAAPWPKGERDCDGAAIVGAVAPRVELAEGREACGADGREVTGARVLGVVTPGMTSYGRTCEPGEAGGFARFAEAPEVRLLADGLGWDAGARFAAGGLGGGAGAFWVAVSTAGASSAGGSWAGADAAQQRTSARGPTNLARGIERTSRVSNERVDTASLKPGNTLNRSWRHQEFWVFVFCRLGLRGRFRTSVRVAERAQARVE